LAFVLGFVDLDPLEDLDLLVDLAAADRFVADNLAPFVTATLTPFVAVDDLDPSALALARRRQTRIFLKRALGIGIL